jgi:DNA helicase II / ATP-dependent DNA helicase PcrA
MPANVPFHQVTTPMTPAQHEAVWADDHHLSIVAGAGTGKTSVLTWRVARRIGDGSAQPRRVLVCTFSRKAAEELRIRLSRLGASGVTAGTIHRLALRLTREQRQRAGQRPPSVLGDRTPLLEDVLRRAGRSRALHRALDAEISWSKARFLTPATYEAEARSANRVVRLPYGAVAGLYADYESRRLAQRFIDLDDLLVEAVRAIGEDRPFADAVQWHHRHLFVDEMQDVTPAQFQLLRSLVTPTSDLCVVGDPNQSIYGWNGADPSLLDRLSETFPDLRVVRLDDNHRCSPEIVRVANRLLTDPDANPSSTRSEGAVPVLYGHDTDLVEADWVAQGLMELAGRGEPWSNAAVLARTNHQLTLVAERLEVQGIPVQLTGGDSGPASDLSIRSPAHAHDVDVPAPTAGPGVTLTTFHRAKGLQWPSVFVIGLSETLVPIGSARSVDALEEERRLLYVALTRAGDHLWCSWAARSDLEDLAVREPSRWLGMLEAVVDQINGERAVSAGPDRAARFAQLRALVSERPDPSPPFLDGSSSAR